MSKKFRKNWDEAFPKGNRSGKLACSQCGASQLETVNVHWICMNCGAWNYVASTFIPINLRPGGVLVSSNTTQELSDGS